MILQAGIVGCTSVRYFNRRKLGGNPMMVFRKFPLGLTVALQVVAFRFVFQPLVRRHLLHQLVGWRRPQVEVEF